MTDIGAPTESLTVTALSSSLAGSQIFVELDSFGIGTNPLNTSSPQNGRRLCRLHAGFA